MNIDANTNKLPGTTCARRFSFYIKHGGRQWYTAGRLYEQLRLLTKREIGSPPLCKMVGDNAATRRAPQAERRNGKSAS